MECFRQIVRCIKSPFQRSQNQKGLEIGPPTNFRKEQVPAFFSDDDTLTSHSLLSTMDKENAMRQSATREKIKQHVRRLSGRSTHQLPDNV